MQINFHRFFVLKLFSVFVTNEIKYLNILFLVYLIFSSIYFSMCFLCDSKLRITSSIFQSLSLYYSFIIPNPNICFKSNQILE